MPFAFVTIGLVMIVSALKGTQNALGQQLVKDFTGQNSFLYWLIAIGVVGSLGYVESLRNFSRLFMTFIVVTMIIKNGGFFNQFMSAIQQGPAAPANASAAIPFPSSTAIDMAVTAAGG